jgi:hypothetical protein
MESSVEGRGALMGLKADTDAKSVTRRVARIDFMVYKMKSNE